MQRHHLAVNKEPLGLAISHSHRRRPGRLVKSVAHCAHGGIGAINVRGLRKEGDHWESESYARSKTKIRVDAQGGIGAVNLIAD